jgi:hypothetical protein
LSAAAAAPRYAGSRPPDVAVAAALLLGLAPAAQALVQAYLGPWIVQDDARQFVFWMARWTDQSLFPDSLIARYFESVTPIAVRAVYWVGTELGLDPFDVNKLLVIPLGLAHAYFTLRLAWLLRPAVVPALCGTLLAVFFVWLIDTLPSATPRGFALPLLLAAVVYHAERRTWATGIAAGLLGLTYPQAALVVAGGLTLSTVTVVGRRPVLDRTALPSAVAGVLCTMVALVPFALESSEFGPIVGAELARTLPAFGLGGRSEFFERDPLEFILCGARSGFLPVEWGCGHAYNRGVALAPVIGLGLLALTVALVLAPLGRRWGGTADNTLARRMPLSLTLSALVGFAAAHALLFQLHVPSRYPHTMLRVIVPMLLGIWLAETVLRAVRGRQDPRSPRPRTVLAASAVFAGLLVAAPVVPNANYVRSTHGALFERLRTLPPDTRVASVSREGDNIPAFGRRDVIGTREYAIPYGWSYYEQVRADTRALLRAIYGLDDGALAELGRDYGVDYVLVDRDAWTAAHVEGAWWSHEYPELAARAAEAVAAGRVPPLARALEDCAAYADDQLVLVEVSCAVSRRAEGEPAGVKGAT